MNEVMKAIKRHADALWSDQTTNQHYHLIRIRQLTESAIIMEEERYD